MIHAATLAAALAVLAGPSAYDEAVAAWKAEDWPAAADAFGRAFEQDPRPELLWSQAQALRFSGDCKHAVEVYERFIAMEPPEVDRESARGHIDRCATELEPAPPAARAEPEPKAARDQPPPARPKRPFEDATAVGLLMGGLAASVVGAALVGSAHAVESDAPDADSEEMYRDEIERAEKRNVIGIVFLAVGGSLLVGSTIRFIIVGRRSKRAVASRVGFGLRF